jgi:nitrogenase subunit NifH
MGIAVAFLDEASQFLAMDRGPSIIDAVAFDIPGFIVGFFAIPVKRKKTGPERRS